MQGSGTSSDPYILSTTADIELLAGDLYASYAGANVYFELGADITNSGTSWSHTPIGSSSYMFNGHFDGKNHTIGNMTITSSSGYSGFFSYVTGAAQISNIVFEDCSVTETGGSYCGMLIGSGQSFSGTISNIETDGCLIVSSKPQVGGIAGTVLACTISNCYVHDGKVYSSGAVVGGIFGKPYNYADGISVTNCTVEREVVIGTSNVGGICGNAQSTNATQTYSNCNVLSSVIFGTNGYVGGCCGMGSSSSITWDTCTVDNTYIISGSSSSTSSNVGGIIGKNASTSTNSITVNSCSVTNCTVYATYYSGGILGYNNAGSSTSSSIANISNPTVSHNNIYGGDSAGGVVGYVVISGVTLTGGTQDYNNIVGTGGVDCATVTNQTSVSGQYITADSLSAVVGSDNKTVTFTVTGQRGAGISYDTTTNLIDGGMNWQYTYPSSSTETVNFDLTETYTTNGTFTPKLHLYNPSNTTGVWLTSNSITIGGTPTVAGISIHDQSFLRRNEKVISNHDQSFMGVWY